MLSTDSDEVDMAPDDLWMIMGYHRGMVLIYNIHSFDIPHCRYDVCREEIIMIREVESEKLHLFYDSSHLLTLVKLGPTGIKVMHQVNIYREIFDLFVLNTSVYMAFKTGDIDWWEVKNLKTNAQFAKLNKSKRTTFIDLAKQLTKSQIKDIQQKQVQSDEYLFIRYDVPKIFDSDDETVAVT